MSKILLIETNKPDIVYIWQCPECKKENGIGNYLELDVDCVKCDNCYRQFDIKLFTESNSLNINWRNPKTELEHNFLSFIFWKDMHKNGYIAKSDSKYYGYIKKSAFDCPNCKFYKDDNSYVIVIECERCCLRVESERTIKNNFLPCDYYIEWFYSDSNIILSQYSYMIYRRLQIKVLELIKKQRGGCNG